MDRNHCKCCPNEQNQHLVVLKLAVDVEYVLLFDIVDHNYYYYNYYFDHFDDLLNDIAVDDGDGCGDDVVVVVVVEIPSELIDIMDYRFSKISKT